MIIDRKNDQETGQYGKNEEQTQETSSEEKR